MTMKAQEQEALLQALQARFEKHMHRHKGIAWAEVRAGVRLRIGTALAQVSVFALPCHKIAASFLDRDMNRIHHDRGPVSRVYATVLEPGGVSLGDAVVLEPER